MVSLSSDKLTHVEVPEARGGEMAGEEKGKGSGEMNVGQVERVVSIMVGGLLVSAGVKRLLSIRGLMLGGLGYALIQRGATGHCAMYSKMNVTSADEESKTWAHPLHQHFHVEESVTVGRPAGEVYAFWKNLENLPKFMGHVLSVKMTEGKRSHWVVKGPGSKQVEWDAETVQEEEGKLISWKSVEGSDVESAGQVRFEEAEGGTRVEVVLTYSPPAGVIGHLAAKLLGADPAAEIREDLAEFKRIIETGVARP